MRIPNDLDEIDGVVTRFNAFAAAHGVSDGVRRTFDMAFDELLNNIVSYGYTDGESHWIDLEIRRAGDLLEATIRDDAQPFDPFARAAPDTDLDVEEREIGGLGIHLVSKMMDSATYERRDGQNVVMITKRWRVASGAQPEENKAREDAD